MSNINCSFNVNNKTGSPLTVSGEGDPDHGNPISIVTNPIPPDSTTTQAATASSCGAGCEGNVYLKNEMGTWEFRYDNPVVGPASTPNQSAPDGHTISIELVNDVWTATCT